MSTVTPAAAAPLAEFTTKAIATGVVLGIVFGAANAYLGLRVGMTVSASIPAAVMTVALFKLFRARGTILEANISQTIGSASTALATGSIFTIPALFLWGIAPPYLQVVALCFLGGILGLAAMVPLRRLLIVQAHDELPYPEGTACAEVLRATTREGSDARSASAWIFRGMAVGAAVKLLISLAYLIPDELRMAVPVLPKAELALEIAPALIGVGYILGYRQAAVCVAGAVISALAITPLIAWMGAAMSGPLYPETTRLVADMSAGDIWSKYVRYIGAGAVATAGILTVLRGLPTMADAFLSVARGLRGSDASAGGSTLRTDRDVPGGFVLGGVALVVLVAGFVPGVFAGDMGTVQRAVLAAGVGVFGVLFVAVAARIVGIVGVSSQPTSGIALVTLLGTASIFAAAGWTDQGGRHLAGPQDRLAGRRHAREAAAWPIDRCRLRMLGSRGHRDAVGQCLRIRLQGNPGAAGDADEDDHRRRACGRAALGPGPDRRRTRHCGDALRRLGARILDRHLPAAGDDGAALRRRLRARTGGA